MEESQRLIMEVLSKIGQVVIGKDDIIRKVLTALLAKGHILIEDIPGVGKTTMAMAFSRVLELSHRRMQFTPDVLPTDVVGFTILNSEGEFEYKPGAVQCNLFLADEINRTSSKTQSALLEVMEEGKVTVDGVTRPLMQPFMVIATQNPSGSIGTQMLPESQLDRFMIRISMGYPTLEDEIVIMRERQSKDPVEELEAIMNGEDILQLQQIADEIYIHDKILYYIAALSDASRKHSMVELGLSPRGTLALAAMSRANALVCGREYVIPSDVEEIFYDVANHRIQLNSKARVSHVSVDRIIADILNQVPAPRVKE